MTDELILRQAADVIYALMRQALEEPSEQNQTDFFLVLNHYLLSGLRIQLRPEGVIVSVFRPVSTHLPSLPKQGPQRGLNA